MTPKEKAIQHILSYGEEGIGEALDIALKEQVKEIENIVNGGFGLNAIQLRKFILKELKQKHLGGKE